MTDDCTQPRSYAKTEDPVLYITQRRRPLLAWGPQCHFACYVTCIQKYLNAHLGGLLSGLEGARGLSLLLGRATREVGPWGEEVWIMARQYLGMTKFLFRIPWLHKRCGGIKLHWMLNPDGFFVSPFFLSLPCIPLSLRLCSWITNSFYVLIFHSSTSVPIFWLIVLQKTRLHIDCYVLYHQPLHSPHYTVSSLKVKKSILFTVLSCGPGLRLTQNTRSKTVPCKGCLCAVKFEKNDHHVFWSWSAANLKSFFIFTDCIYSRGFECSSLKFRSVEYTLRTIKLISFSYK